MARFNRSVVRFQREPWLENYRVQACVRIGIVSKAVFEISVDGSDIDDVLHELVDDLRLAIVDPPSYERRLLDLQAQAVAI